MTMVDMIACQECVNVMLHLNNILFCFFSVYGIYGGSQRHSRRSIRFSFKDIGS